jgi:hypothetical protein
MKIPDSPSIAAKSEIANMTEMQESILTPFAMLVQQGMFSPVEQALLTCDACRF